MGARWFVRAAPAGRAFARKNRDAAKRPDRPTRTRPCAQRPVNLVGPRGRQSVAPSFAAPLLAHTMRIRSVSKGAAYLQKSDSPRKVHPRPPLITHLSTQRRSPTTEQPTN